MKKLLAFLAIFAASCSPLPAQNTLAGNLTVQQAVKLTGAITPAAITAPVNDYAPAGFSAAAVVRLHADAPRTITGLAGGVAGRMVWLSNVGAQTISLATESPLSTAANRFAFGASGFDLLPGGSLSIWYDSTAARWRAATNLAAGGGGVAVDQTARDAAAAAQATADSKQAAFANAGTLAKVTESGGLPLWDGAAWPGGGSGGTGTVTSVSVVPTNGVSGSVANASTTPAITLSLGAIAPSSVTATGVVTGSNLSGTNTGDQTSVTGNAGTATKLATARAINGVSFDGTAAITVPAAAGTLTGSTLASGVTASSLTSAAGGTFGTAAFTAASAYDPAGAAAAITLAGLGGVPTSRTVNGHALSGNVTVTPSDLSLVVGTNTQAWSAKLDTVSALAAGTGWLHNDGAGVLAWSMPSKSDVGLGSVENTALSTWAGSSNLATVGTISAGTWHGTAIADTYIASASAWNAKVSFPGFGTTGSTACVGNDSRLSDARTPTAHNQAWSTITATPTTLSGYGITDAQGLDSDLTALASNATNGLWARTGSGAGAARTITGTTSQITVTNGDGVSGNPTLALPQSIATTSTPQFAGVLVVDSAPSLQFKGPSTTARGRLYESDVNAGSVDLTSNISFDGSNWQRDDTTHPATVLKAWDGKFSIRRVAAGANPASLSISLSLSDSGILQLGAYGAGTLVTDSSGNVTASSDARLKNVSGKFTRGLDAIAQLQPKVYTWKPESGMNPDDINVGFLAQDVQPAIPEAVGSMKTTDTEEDDGTGKKVKRIKRVDAEFLSLSDRPIIAALVNAANELNAKNDELETRISKLEAKK